MDETQARQDADHLRTLSILHYVMAGLAVLGGCFPMIHLTVGSALLLGGLSGHKGDGAPAAMVGGMFVAIAIVFIGAAWTLAACLFMAGRSLAQRRRHLFCLVIAGLMAATCVPLGTILGIFTIVVLLRPSVKQLFGVA